MRLKTFMSESIARFKRPENQSRNLNWKKISVRKWKCSGNNKTGATSRAGPAYPSEHLSHVARSLVVCVMFCRTLSLTLYYLFRIT
jgi:hypothetical protein